MLDVTTEERLTLRGPKIVTDDVFEKVLLFVNVFIPLKLAPVNKPYDNLFVVVS
jgi:hypothetical protein